jgi:hypothetical protein
LTCLLSYKQHPKSTSAELTELFPGHRILVHVANNCFSLAVSIESPFLCFHRRFSSREMEIESSLVILPSFAAQRKIGWLDPL